MVGLCNKGFLFTISLGPFQPDWRLEVGTDWEWLLLIYLTHIISFSCFSWNASSLPRRCEHCLMLFDDWNDWIRVSLSCRTWNDWPLCTHLSLSFILKNMLSEFCSPKCPPNDFTHFHTVTKRHCWKWTIIFSSTGKSISYSAIISFLVLSCISHSNNQCLLEENLLKDLYPFKSSKHDWPRPILNTAILKWTRPHHRPSPLTRLASRSEYLYWCTFPSLPSLL